MKNSLYKKNDFFCKLSKENKFRSRSWYKIKEIDVKYNIFKNNSYVLEVGCYPGGWTQYIKYKTFKGKLISFDIKEIFPIKNIFFFKSDLNNLDNVVNHLLKINFNKKFNIIVSDVCNKLTGKKIIDINHHMNLLYKLDCLCNLFLHKNGYFITKIFNVLDIKIYTKYIFSLFKNNFIFKPKSSLPSSSEHYLICKYYL